MDDFGMRIAKYKIESVGNGTDLISLDIFVYGKGYDPSNAMEALKIIDQQCFPKIFPEQKA